MDKATRLRRWQLILGQDARQRLSCMGAQPLRGEDEIMDRALAALYTPERRLSREGRGGRGGSLDPSRPHLVRWLDDIRGLFSSDLVSVLQADAVERCGLKALLLEPELLDHVEPNVQMVATLLSLKDQVPDRSREAVRAYVGRVVEELDKVLAEDLRRSVTAALNRRRHSPVPSAGALDFRTTIARGLRNYHRELGTIVPERCYFFERSNRSANRRTVILDIDQSASMGESVVHASVMACILAGMNSLETRVVAFDTSVVDLSSLCADPVDLLFGFQLGGGTDIGKSVAYCQELVRTPAKTLFFLISDLEEGGNRAALVRRLEEMRASGVLVVCLLAISQAGTPVFDTTMARRLAVLGIPCFACTPHLLPKLMEEVIRGRNVADFARREGLTARK